jgi:hypothetical protein
VDELAAAPDAPTGGEPAEAEPADPVDAHEPGAGQGIVTLSWVGTGIFAAAATVATLLPDDAARAAAVIDGVLFAIGVVAFLWGYAVAVQRSRTDAIGIGGLYFLAGSAPRSIRVRLLGALAVQVVIAVVSASIRPYTAVAFGILVPMLGLGLAGLWGARHGTFPPRDRPAAGD